ncbi:Carboxylesterase patB [Psilocybe cubensis]|uniref:Carboxylesterase patB n=1 Tax=Psilocybe cubensis TaxID=181762 RepID=A0ACB8GU39_PSICU|nr:Carboxylesterase patB [Psilocybe cubensis]KAH9478952.1 Carboxylesterase patB [Psilocybe cubensis]
MRLTTSGIRYEEVVMLWEAHHCHKVKESGTLNAGLLDQQFAMKWVQQHISKFGGDANKVTIWGESSGAGSVLQHIVANGGRTRPPLFRAAITSSTYLPSQYRFDDQIPETLFSETLAKTNCSSAIDSLECLRKVDVDTLQNANTEIYTSGFFGTFAFVPVVDGRFITNRPTVLLKNGRLNGKTHLSVTNTFEGTRFVNQTTANTVEVPTYVTQLFPQLTPQQAKMVADQYAPLGTPIFQVNAIMGESIFICPTYMLLRAFDQRGFKGEFAIPPGSHGLDVSFYFNNGVLPSAFPNQQFVTAFAESFQNFVVSLDPNVKSDRADITSLWKQWGGSNEMLFNLTETGTPDIRSIQTSHDLLKRCDFWESMTSATSQ